MVALKDTLRKFFQGYNKTAVFALTTQCNCKCIMCDMHKNKPEYINLSEAKKVLKFLQKNKFLIAYFTGGEPTLHPNIIEIVEYASKLGILSTMTSNGTLTKTLLQRLKKAGLYLLSVSLDHWDPYICENLRNHKNIFSKQLDTINYSRNIGLKTYVLAFLNPFLVNDGVEKLIDYANFVLNVPFGFCYPTKSNNNSFVLGGILSDTELSNKIDISVNKILNLKKKGRNIANLWVYMQDVLNLRMGKKPFFYCKGGEDVIYVDWRGDVYPCFLKEKLFNIFKEKPYFLKNVKCNDCLINCFREPSVLPQLIYSPNLLAMEILYSYSSRWIYV